MGNKIKIIGEKILKKTIKELIVLFIMKLKSLDFGIKKPNLYAFLFYPLAIFIQLLNSLKNKVPKNNFKIKTICLGNIYIGGTGKTSLCITLKNILNKKILDLVLLKNL